MRDTEDPRSVHGPSDFSVSNIQIPDPDVELSCLHARTHTHRHRLLDLLLAATLLHSRYPMAQQAVALELHK